MLDVQCSMFDVHFLVNLLYETTWNSMSISWVLLKKDMSGNSLRSHPDLHNDENVGDNRWLTCGAKKTTGRMVFTAVERHRRMPYLKNLVGQVAPQALPDLRENSLYEALSFFFNQTGRFSGQGGAHMNQQSWITPAAGFILLVTAGLIPLVVAGFIPAFKTLNWFNWRG